MIFVTACLSSISVWLFAAYGLLGVCLCSAVFLSVGLSFFSPYVSVVFGLSLYLPLCSAARSPCLSLRVNVFSIVPSAVS